MGRKVTTLIPYYGSNRTLAENVGRALTGCTWVGVPFAGGMCELGHITAASIVVSDVHRHVINLARVARESSGRKELVRLLSETIVHPDQLSDSQAFCNSVEDFGFVCNEQYWAYHYFIAAWMSRNGTAGTKNEFDSTFSVRWKDGGGDSAMRFRSATAALEDFGGIMQRCTFVVEDCFEFLNRCHDLPKHGLYCDPPFPGPGDKYKHSFTIEDHRDLARRLAEFEQTLVVCRFYDHPLIRKLYPEDSWEWGCYAGRRQTNTAGPEVLLVKKGRS